MDLGRVDSLQKQCQSQDCEDSGTMITDPKDLVQQLAKRQQVVSQFQE